MLLDGPARLPRKERSGEYNAMWRSFESDSLVACVNFSLQASRYSSTPRASKSVARYPHPMARNIIHSDVSVDPESESEALSIAPDAEEEPEVEPEEEEEEGEGDVDVDVEEEDEDGEEGDDGDEGEEEGEEVDEPEEEEEDEEPGDDGDGDAVREVRRPTHSSLALTHFHADSQTSINSLRHPYPLRQRRLRPPARRD